MRPLQIHMAPMKPIGFFHVFLEAFGAPSYSASRLVKLLKLKPKKNKPRNPQLCPGAETPTPPFPEVLCGGFLERRIPAKELLQVALDLPKHQKRKPSKPQACPPRWKALVIVLKPRLEPLAIHIWSLKKRKPENTGTPPKNRCPFGFPLKPGGQGTLKKRRTTVRIRLLRAST